MIPEKIPQDFYSRPTDKRIEWWNLFLQSLSETIKDVLKKITNKDTVLVDGVQKKLLWKTFTGTTDAGGDTTTVAHGLTLSKILFVNLIVQNSGTDWYNYHDHTQTYVQFDSTNLYVVAIPAGFRNEAYKVTVAYYE